MAISAVPFALQNVPVNADVVREAVSSLIPNTGGIVQSGDFPVAQTTVASMAVTVGVGRAWIPGSEVTNLTGQSYSKQGMYFVMNDGSVTLSIDPADSTNPRIDVVYIAIQDANYSGTNNAAVLAVAKGFPASTPAVPTLPNNAIALANVAVGAGVSTIVTANITTRLTGVPVGKEPAGQIATQAYASGTGNIAYNFLVIIADVTTPWLPAGRNLRITLETDANMSASSGICAIGLKNGGTTGVDNGNPIRNCAVSYQSATSTESSDLTFHYTTIASGVQRFYAISTAVLPSGATVSYPANGRRITVYDDGAV